MAEDEHPSNPMDNSRFVCRMYRAKYPELDDLVMVNVRQIADMGAYVKLKEYNDIEGMILLSELSRRRIRSLQKLIRVGRDEVAVVLRVDKEKGYIDLSKRRVSAEDKDRLEEKYNKSKAVQTIMRHVAEKLDIPLLELHEMVTWPLYEKYGHAFDAFKLVITSPEAVFSGLSMPPAVLQELLTNVRRRMSPTTVKLRAEVDITCFAYEGICAIRRALKSGETASNDHVTIKVRLVAPPLYVVTASTIEMNLGVETIDKALHQMEVSLAADEGTLVVKVRPRVISANDERELAALMERVEKENAEVSGDDDDDEAPETDDESQ